MKTPQVISDQDILVSKSDSVVTIECNDGANAEEVFDWLMDKLEKAMDESN